MMELPYVSYDNKKEELKEDWKSQQVVYQSFRKD